MDFNKFFQSRAFKAIVVVIAAVILVLLSFTVGVAVGYRKARFSYDWSEYYDRNFGGPKHAIFGFPPSELFPGSPPPFMSAHGTFGSILSIASSSIVVGGRDNPEKVVLVSSSTVIEERREAVKLADLKVNDPVVVIGSPNSQGQIEARFIRVMY